MSIWETPRKQKISSAKTSLCQVPALLRRAPLSKGVNLDIGGGACDRGSSFLRKRGITSVVFDPFNRTPQENRTAARKACCGKAANVTTANVLNVVKEPGARQRILQQAADAVGSRGTAYFAVYEGDRSGSGRATSKGWQANRSLQAYLPEVRRVFRDAQIENGAIVARAPKRATCSCPR